MNRFQPQLAFNFVAPLRDGALGRLGDRTGDVITSRAKSTETNGLASSTSSPSSAPSDSERSPSQSQDENWAFAAAVAASAAAAAPSPQPPAAAATPVFEMATASVSTNSYPVGRRKSEPAGAARINPC